MSISKNVIWYAAYGYLLMPVTVGANILLRRWIDPYHFGLISLLTIIATYSLFANLGILSYAEIKLPYLKSIKDGSDYDELRFYAYKASILGGVAFSLLTFLFFAYSPVYSSNEIQNAVFIYIIYLLTYQIVSYQITIQRTNNNFIFLAKFQFVVSFLTNVMVLVSAYYAGFMGYICALTSSMVLQVIFLKYCSEPQSTIAFNYRVFLNLIKKSVKIFCLGGISILLRSIDSVFVGIFFGATSLGYYSLAPIGVTMIFAVTNSVGNVLFPRMQMELGQGGNHSEVFERFITEPLLLAALFLPLGIGFIYYLVPPILAIVAPVFLPGINAFRVLVWGAYFFSLINILSAYLVAQDRQILFSKIYLVTIFFITILVFLMSKFELGIVGVAMATSLSYLIAFGAIFYLSLPQWTLQVRVNQVALIIFLSPVVGISNIICIELISGWTHISFDPFNLLKLVFYLSASITEILYINSYFGLIDKYIQRLKMVRFLGIN